MFRATAAVIIPAVLLTRAAAADPAAVRAAVEKALPLLVKGADGHVAERTCFACHSQAQPILAFTAARDRGLAVPAWDLPKQLDFIAAFLDRNRGEYRKGKGQGGQVDTAGYALWSLELGGRRPDATTEAVVEYFLRRDADRDHWRTTSNRPPSEVSDFTATYLALRALKAWATPEQRERATKRIDAARDWLTQTAAKDTEDRVFRLLALQAADAEVRSAADELLRSQRPDGGWAQTDALDSDAYATGSALFALHEAGGLATTVPTYQRGVEYLLKTQLPDGTWHVRTRSKPFQAYFETGFPHGKDQFISSAATGWAAAALILALPPAAAGHQVIVTGQAAGGYAAFPDVCRTKSGDLLCVFYSGGGHVTLPSKDWPNGGRIMAVRSTDDGATWSEPAVLFDTPYDDRDPHVAALRDGTLICSWFVTPGKGQPPPGGKPHAVYLARSADQGKTWSEPAELKIDAPEWFACSAPVRELADGSLIVGLYTETEKGKRAYGATVRSTDGGTTWGDLARIGDTSGVYLDAETDVVQLQDKSLLAALRSSKVDLHFANSSDGGKSWGPVRSSGFKGHSPHFLRHSSGAILLSHRLPRTAVHWSFDDGKTWQGPLQVDDVPGAYPSCVELRDGRVLCVYYEEGRGSGIRAARLAVGRDGVTLVP
ncbi:MAG TPA: exo-alpha-sialidase [Gemmataceae bacterium]|jgi:hypothetical protein